MSIKKERDRVTPSLGRIKLEVSKLPREAYNFFKDITPKKSGNAKARTKLQRETINANYPNALPLGKGRSKQAPRGMTQPTIEYIRRIAKNKIRT